eukprot:scaffold496574_cov38-Prasinocladus_malaysianus.AAC.3
MSMRADIVYGKKLRFTANPVQLPTTTGTLRMAAPKVNVSSTTCAGPKHVSDPFAQHYTLSHNITLQRRFQRLEAYKHSHSRDLYPTVAISRCI